MPAIGEMLREARMRQGLDITDVESSTKIRAKYLRALENEEWAMLPGTTFVKTFLRTYSEALGLDPHLIVEEYRVHHEELDELELQPLSPRTTPGTAGRRDRRGRQGRGGPPPGLALGLIVAAVLAFLIVLGLSGDDEPEQAAVPTETTERPRPDRPRPKPVPKRVVLRLAPDGDTYVCVDRGEGSDVLFEGTIAEPQTFRGRRLRLNLGRRAGRITVNGRPVEIEPSGEPAGFEFLPRRTRELAAEERPCT